MGVQSVFDLQFIDILHELVCSKRILATQYLVP